MKVRGASGWLVGLGAVSLGACQLVSGLSDLETGGPGSGGEGGAGSSAASSGEGGSAGGGGQAGGGGAAGGGGQVEGCTAAAAECPEIILSNAPVPVERLTVDGGYVYWSYKGQPNEMPGMRTGAIYRFLIGSADAPVRVVSDSNPNSVAVSSKHGLVYWSDEYAPMATVLWESVGSIDKQGTTLVNAAMGEVFRVATIAPEGTGNLYWASSNATLWAEDLASAPGNLLGIVSQATGSIYAIAGDGMAIYWHGMNGIERPTADPMIKALVVTTTPEMWGLAVDDTNVYFTERSPNGTVSYANKSGTNQVQTVLASMQSYPSHVAVDKYKRVYWVNDGDVDCAKGSGVVMRTSLGPEPDATKVLAVGLKCVSNFAQDSNFIYWGSGDTIYRASTIPSN
jgi:hypothetical protein